MAIFDWSCSPNRRDPVFFTVFADYQLVERIILRSFFLPHKKWQLRSGKRTKNCFLGVHGSFLLYRVHLKRQLLIWSELKAGSKRRSKSLLKQIMDNQVAWKTEKVNKGQSMTCKKIDAGVEIKNWLISNVWSHLICISINWPNNGHVGRCWRREIKAPAQVGEIQRKRTSMRWLTERQKENYTLCVRDVCSSIKLIF